MGPGGVCLLIACILMKKQDIRAITALICSKVISNKNFLLYTLARKLRLRRTSDGDWSIWTLLKTKPTLFSRFVVQRCELRYRRGSCQVKKSCSKVGSCVFVFVMLSQTAKIQIKQWKLSNARAPHLFLLFPLKFRRSWSPGVPGVFCNFLQLLFAIFCIFLSWQRSIITVVIKSRAMAIFLRDVQKFSILILGNV